MFSSQLGTDLRSIRAGLVAVLWLVTSQAYYQWCCQYWLILDTTHCASLTQADAAGLSHPERAGQGTWAEQAEGRAGQAEGTDDPPKEMQPDLAAQRCENRR